MAPKDILRTKVEHHMHQRKLHILLLQPRKSNEHIDAKSSNSTYLTESDQVDDVQSTGFGFGQLEVVRRKAGTSPDVIRKAP